MWRPCIRYVNYVIPIVCIVFALIPLSSYVADLPNTDFRKYPDHPGSTSDYGGIMGMHFLWEVVDGKPNRQKLMY